GEEPTADYTVAGNDYFRTMNISLLRGRVFGDQDVKESPQVMVVSNAFVNRYFPNEDPIGRQIVFDSKAKTALEIVGVVADVHRNGLDVAPEPEIYVSYLQRPERRLNLILRADSGNALDLAP